MLGIGTFVLGKEKESKSDKVRIFTATEWVPHYDRNAGASRHHTRFVSLKFMGYKMQDIGNWNEGDTVFVSGVYNEEPYMGTLDEKNGYQHNNAVQGYEPRAGGEIMVDTCVEVQLSKASKDKLGVQNGGWGFRNKDSGGGDNSGSRSGGGGGNSGGGGGNSGYSGRGGNSGYSGRGGNAQRGNSGQQRQSRNDDDGGGDDYDQEPRGNGNSSQQQGAGDRNTGRGNDGPSRGNDAPRSQNRPAPEPANEEIDEFDSDLDLPE